MPHFALDLSKSLATSAAAAPPLGPIAPGGSARNGFEGHLQRASQEGGKPKDAAAESSPGNGSSAADSSTNDSHDKPTRPRKNSDFHTAPGNESPSSVDNAASPVDNSRGNPDDGSSFANQPNAEAGNAKANPDSAQTPPTGVQIVVAATAVVTAPQTVAAPDPSPPSADAAQQLQSTTNPEVSPATPIPAAASNASLTTGSIQPADAAPSLQSAATTIPPDPASGVASAADTATVQVQTTMTIASAAVEKSPDDSQLIQPPPGSVAGDPTAPIGPSASTITDASATVASNSAAAGVRATTDSNAAPTTTAVPNSPPPIRDPHPKNASTIASVIDAQAIAAAVSITSAAADGQPVETSAGGPARKQDGAPAIDSLAAKTTTQGPGQTPASGAAAQSADSGGTQPSAQSASSSGAGEVDRVRFLQRVSSAFRAADEQGGQIRLRLSPPELGSMRLELTMRNGTMTAHVQAETDSARNMLLDHLPQLRERLADHNIKIDHFDVELMNQSNSGTPQNFAGQRDTGYPLGQEGPRRAPNGAATAAALAPVANGRRLDGRLDVTV
jgi:flagellar hook-length control protein FliK